MSKVSPEESQPKMASYDDLTVNKLAKVHEFDMRQTMRWDDVGGCSCYGNLYSFHDRNLPASVPGTELSVGTPVFIIEEESNLCCRLCCSTCQPMTLKLYHADPNVVAGTTCCGKYPGGHKYSKDAANAEVIASFDRPGCGTKVLGAGCPTFCACCQDEVFMFPGNKVGEPGKLWQEGGFIATSIQPICGGGCTPTLELSEGAEKNTSPYAWIEGPTCFGGCKDLFCRTPFQISSQKGKSGDIGSIIKKTPEGAMEMCCAMCSDVDGYEITINQQSKMSDTQKLNFLGSAVQLDFMFFEKDNDYVSTDGQCVYISVCNWFMFGMLAPVTICIPLGSGGGDDAGGG